MIGPFSVEGGHFYYIDFKVFEFDHFKLTIEQMFDIMVVERWA